MSPRILYLDVARGLGCLLVVLGHNDLVAGQRGVPFAVIFSFHVPLFFFLSGLFLKVDLPLGELARKRADSLLKPFFVTFLLLAIDDVLLQSRVEPLEYLKGVLYANGLTIPWTPLWFLPHLWLLSVVAWLVCRRTRIDQWPLFPQLVALFGAVVLGASFVEVFLDFRLQVADAEWVLQGLPFSIDLVLLSGAYFVAGYVMRQEVRASLRFKPWVTLLVGLLFIGLHTVDEGFTMDLNLRRYDHAVFSTVVAALGIYLTMSAAWLFAQYTPGVARVLAYVGSGSLFVLIFHQVLQDKAFRWVSSRLPEARAAAACASFVLAVLAPLVSWEVVKRVKPLALLYLPAGGAHASSMRPSGIRETASAANVDAAEASSDARKNSTRGAA